MAHRFTIGVEEEFQIIDPATCDLRSHVSQLVSAASPGIIEQVKHEMHQSIVETGTNICQNVAELRIEMHRTRGELVAAAKDRWGDVQTGEFGADMRVELVNEGPVTFWLEVPQYGT